MFVYLGVVGISVRLDVLKPGLNPQWQHCHWPFQGGTPFYTQWLRLSFYVLMNVGISLWVHLFVDVCVWVWMFVVIVACVSVCILVVVFDVGVELCLLLLLTAVFIVGGISCWTVFWTFMANIPYGAQRNTKTHSIVCNLICDYPFGV